MKKSFVASLLWLLTLFVSAQLSIGMPVETPQGFRHEPIAVPGLVVKADLDALKNILCSDALANFPFCANRDNAEQVTESTSAGLCRCDDCPCAVQEDVAPEIVPASEEDDDLNDKTNENEAHQEASAIKLPVATSSVEEPLNMDSLKAAAMNINNQIMNRTLNGGDKHISSFYAAHNSTNITHTTHMNVTIQMINSNGDKPEPSADVASESTSTQPTFDIEDGELDDIATTAAVATKGQTCCSGNDTAENASTEGTLEVEVPPVFSLEPPASPSGPVLAPPSAPPSASASASSSASPSASAASASAPSASASASSASASASSASASASSASASASSASASASSAPASEV